MFNNWTNISLITFGWLLLSFGLQAQQTLLITPKTNSPYSRFGVGDLLNQGFGASTGMAGLGAAFNDPYHTNWLNPASLPYLQSTAFEVGLYGRYSSLKNANQQTDVWSGNLSYLSLAFPLKNPINRVLDQNKSPWDFGMSLSLAPYSQVGYELLLNDNKNPEVGLESQTLKGSGGTYRFQWGTGAKYKNLSLGVNIGYHFGNLINSRRITLDSISFSYATELLDEVSIGGFIWNAGAQYSYDIAFNDKDKVTKRFIFGVAGNNSQSFNTRSDAFYARENVSVFGANGVDTLFIANGVEGTGTLPANFSVGVTYEEINRLRLGVEYQSSAWSQYKNTAKPDVLSDTYRIALGGEYIPDVISYNNYWERVRYRFGAYYGTDPRSVNGEQLTDYGVSLGFGLPIIMPRQQISFLDIAVQAGQFGLADGLRENYIQMTLGFTLNDNSWFFKRKFN